MLQLKREIYLEVPPSKEPSGTIKLGISESLCYEKFPKLLLKYRKKYPKVNIQIQFINHETFPKLLKNGALDLVYTLNPLIQNDELCLLEKKREYLAFFASPKHPLTQSESISEKDLENVPLLLTSSNCNFRHMLVEDLSRHNITPCIALETSSKEILKQFAINQLGIGFIPVMSAQNEIKEGKLKQLDWKGKDFPIYSQLIIYKGKRLSRAAEELKNMIMEL